MDGKGLFWSVETVYCLSNGPNSKCWILSYNLFLWLRWMDNNSDRQQHVWGLKYTRTINSLLLGSRCKSYVQTCKKGNLVTRSTKGHITDCICWFKEVWKSCEQTFHLTKENSRNVNTESQTQVKRPPYEGI